MEALIEKVGADNLRLAAGTALLSRREEFPEAVQVLEAGLGLWLLAASQVDLAAKPWGIHVPLHDWAERAGLAGWIALVPDAPIVLDAVCIAECRSRWFSDASPGTLTKTVHGEKGLAGFSRGP